MASPFEGIETIRDIGSGLPAKIGGVYNQEEHRRAVDRWIELRQAPLPPSVENRDFFNSHMGDSFFVELDITPEFVRVTLDEDDACYFANALSDLLDVPRPPGPWPVDLILRDPREVQVLGYDEFGILGECIAPPDLRDSLTPGFWAEWFFDHGARLGWVGEFFGEIIDPITRQIGQYLLVDCASACAVDRRLPALVEAFGSAVAPLWEDAMSEFLKPGTMRTYWILDDLIAFLPGRMKVHGIDRSSFKS